MVFRLQRFIETGSPMNKLLLALLGAVALSSSLPAVAGPDWTVIERARAEARARHTAPCASCVQPVDQAAAPAAAAGTTKPVATPTLAPAPGKAG
jgi:hypothetical protein